MLCGDLEGAEMYGGANLELNEEPNEEPRTVRRAIPSGAALSSQTERH